MGISEKNLKSSQYLDWNFMDLGKGPSFLFPHPSLEYGWVEGFLGAEFLKFVQELHEAYCRADEIPLNCNQWESWCTPNPIIE